MEKEKLKGIFQEINPAGDVDALAKAALDLRYTKKISLTIDGKIVYNIDRMIVCDEGSGVTSFMLLSTDKVRASFEVTEEGGPVIYRLS